MIIPVTSLYGGLLGIGYSVLGLQVTLNRLSLGLALGDGTVEIAKDIQKQRDEKESKKRYLTIQRAIRVHANYGEWVPWVLILMGSLEANNAITRKALHIAGITAILGRILHITGIYSGDDSMGTGRKVGYLSTLGLIVTLGGVNVYKAYEKLFK